MGETIPDKNVEVNGKIIGANSTVRLTIKTALWIITGLFGIVITILSYAYFDLKKDLNASHSDFVKNVDDRVHEMTDDIQNIRIDQATIKGDIKLILDRQTRDNPIHEDPNVMVEPTVPPE